MKCIVTCGPTYEPLDKVRRLTNFSTGRLGTELAGFLMHYGHEVLLLRGVQSTYANTEGELKVQSFTTTEDLGTRLLACVKENHGAIFHAAAVSDFRFGKIWQRAGDATLHELSAGKIETREGTLLAELIPTTKILPQLRNWYPAAFIVGWKYELDGTRQEAEKRALRQLEESQSNLCVLNGAAYGEGFGLVSPGGAIQHATSAEELYQVLAHLLNMRQQR